jgi:hypothetical protein
VFARATYVEDFAQIVADTILSNSGFTLMRKYPVAERVNSYIAEAFSGFHQFVVIDLDHLGEDGASGLDDFRKLAGRDVREFQPKDASFIATQVMELRGALRILVDDGSGGSSMNPESAELRLMGWFVCMMYEPT